MSTPTAGELMLPLAEYAAIDGNRTVREALIALSKAQLGLTYDRHHHRAILVLGRHGEVIGKLTHHSVLCALAPSGLPEVEREALVCSGVPRQYIDTLSRQMEERETDLAMLCSRANRVLAEDAMVPAGETISEDTTLAEIVHRFSRARTQSFLVTRGEKVVGILRMSDVFEEVADRIRDAT